MLDKSCIKPLSEHHKQLVSSYGVKTANQEYIFLFLPTNKIRALSAMTIVMENLFFFSLPMDAL